MRQKFRQQNLSRNVTDRRACTCWFRKKYPAVTLTHSWICFINIALMQGRAQGVLEAAVVRFRVHEAATTAEEQRVLERWPVNTLKTNQALVH